MPGERLLWLLRAWSVRSTPVVSVGVALGGGFRGEFWGGIFARDRPRGGWDSQHLCVRFGARIGLTFSIRF